MAYRQQNGRRETELTKAVDAAMEASIVYYDALATASAMHQNPVYARVCNAYVKVQRAHRDFLRSINKVVEDSVAIKAELEAELKKERRLQQYRECAKRKRLGLTKTAPLPRGPKKVLDTEAALG